MRGIVEHRSTTRTRRFIARTEPIEPDESDLIQTNSSCIHLNLSAWQTGGCPISHFSIEHRQLGDIRWTVVSSDISNAGEHRDALDFCDFAPATWYQLKMSASNDAGRTMTTLNFATLNLAGERIPVPQVFPGGHGEGGVDGLGDSVSGVLMDQSDWLLASVVAALVTVASFLL